MASDAVRRRLDALTAVIRPADSAAARVDTLSVQDRAIFETWRHDCKAWHAQHNATPEAAYVAYLGGDEGPVLRYRIARHVFGNFKNIAAGASLASIQDIYQKSKI